MDGDDDNLPTPPEWIEALADGEADIAAGRTVAWSEVKARLLAIIAEAEAEDHVRSVLGRM